MRIALLVGGLLGLAWANPQYQANSHMMNPGYGSSYGNTPSYPSGGHNQYHPPNQPNTNTMGGLSSLSYPGGGGGYMPSGGNSYPSSSISPNLLQVKQEAEAQLFIRLEDQVRRGQFSSHLSPNQIEQNKRDLLQQLRTELNREIQQALRNRFGNQGIRGSHSYSIVNGRFSTTPNYSNQELSDLTSQIEIDLTRRLEEEIRRLSGSSGSSMGMGVGHTTPGPYHTLYPALPTAPSYSQVSAITARVETTLNNYVDKVLENTQRKYFQSSHSSGQRPNYNWDQILRQLHQELRDNITYHLDNEIRRNPSQNRREFDDFKRVVEQNLRNKLTVEFNRQKEVYLRGSGGSYQPNPTMPSSGFDNRYGSSYPGAPTNYPQYNRSSTYPAQPYQPYGTASQSIDWSNIQRQVQDELLRELRGAVQSQQRQLSYNRPAIELQLSAEISQNVTRELSNQLSRHNYRSQGTYDSQLEHVKTQIQTELVRQLQQLLHQYSGGYGSSHNRHYRAVRSIDVNSDRAVSKDKLTRVEPDLLQKKNTTKSQITTRKSIVSSVREHHIYEITSDSGSNQSPSANLSKNQRLTLQFGRRSSGQPQPRTSADSSTGEQLTSKTEPTVAQVNPEQQPPDEVIAISKPTINPTSDAESSLKQQDRPNRQIGAISAFLIEATDEDNVQSVRLIRSGPKVIQANKNEPVDDINDINDIQHDLDADIFHGDFGWQRLVYPTNYQKRNASEPYSNTHKNLKFGRPKNDTQPDDFDSKTTQITDDSYRIKTKPNSEEIETALDQTTKQNKTELAEARKNRRQAFYKQMEDEYNRLLADIVKLEEKRRSRKPKNFGEQPEDQLISQTVDAIQAQKNRPKVEPCPCQVSENKKISDDPDQSDIVTTEINQF